VERIEPDLKLVEANAVTEEKLLQVSDNLVHKSLEIKALRNKLKEIGNYLINVSDTPAKIVGRKSTETKEIGGVS